MFILNEADREYRHGDHGPKYLEKGPRMNFGIVQILPGGTVSTHVHKIVQESFFVLDGAVEATVDGKTVVLRKGDYIHLEPAEVHTFHNNSDVNARMIVTAAPFVDGDKEEVK